MVKINEGLVALIGGIWSLKATLLIDVLNDFSITEGPSLNHGRYVHSCGTFNYNDKTMVIVAGGSDGSKYITTELWDPSSNSGWVKGIYKMARKNILLSRVSPFCQKLKIQKVI